MHLFQRKMGLISFGAFFVLLLFFITPAHSLIIPPDPFGSTDRFALLNSTPNGTITQVSVKVKAPGPDPLGPGQLWALLQYKIPGNNKFFSSASSAINIQGLSTATLTLIQFDFSNEPMPANAYHRRLRIYYQRSPETLPLSVTQYHPGQLVVSSLESAYQTPPPPAGGTLIFGPITFFREREKPKTEQIFFTIPDNTGPFLLRLTNGTPEGVQRASSSWVKLNGSEIFRPPQFNQNVPTLSRQVTLLTGENSLEVRLRSAPGSFVTIEIFRLEQHACPVLGLHTFIRRTGKPLEETVNFDLPSQFVEPFVLNVTSGNPDGSSRVDSATITLNGILIFDPNDFSEQTGFLSQGVSLLPTNTLDVQISGTPGDLLAVEIVGYNSTPPSVTITSPSNGAAFSTGPISVSGIVNDSSASVTVNGIAASVGSDGSFTVDGIALVEGANTVKATAVDGCGNQGEEQILVYLRTSPQGPQLVLCAVKIEPTLMSMQDEECKQQVFTFGLGTVNGTTDDTAVSVTFNGVLLPDGQEIFEQGPIQWALRQGPEFNVDLWLPEDGTYPFTAVATDANGNRTEATVTFIRDTVPPNLIITSPPEGLVTNSPTITITGTVDDPEAIVIDGYGMEIPVVNGTFTTQVTLEEGQWNFIWIGAIDPAGNLANAWFQITLDTIPPQINITHPTEGMAVNSPTLNVAGTIIDQNTDTVTVKVNSGPPQLLALTGNNFGGTVTLSPGSNTLTFHAVDKAGNTGSFTRSILLDPELPTVAITAPQVDGVISGVVTVMVEASDTASGITSVTLYVDAQAHATLNQLPFNFTLDTSTFASGTHTLTVRAKDRAGNESEASVSVTIDNAPPIVAITTPLSGVVVSGLITVSVQASDPISGIANVSLYVDGQLQATRAQPPFNLPLNTLPFASGTHTITAKAVDNKGNQAEASILLVFDHTPPVVSITSPASGATVSGTIAVTVEASDAISGVASVALYVNNLPHSTLNQPPFNFTVDTSGFVPGPYSVTARAIDGVGNQAEASITISVSAFRIEIISPVNGAAINKSKTIVYGRIYEQTGETGVVVNGVLAEVQGSDFAAIVPLQIGENILTTVATASDGFQVQTSVTIGTASQQETVRLMVYPSSGILKPPANTLDVTFEAEAYLPNPVASYSWDFNGDGTPEITGVNLKVVAQYQNPGLYFPRVTVTDTQGNAYTESTIVNIFSFEEMDTLLGSKWEGMKGAMINRDVEKAGNYFPDWTRDRYTGIFSALGDRLPQIAQDMQNIGMIYLIDGVAKYRIRRIEGTGEITYYIYFVRDENGLWKIQQF
jgi:hypothetical protein